MPNRPVPKHWYMLAKLPRGGRRTAEFGEVIAREKRFVMEEIKRARANIERISQIELVLQCNVKHLEDAIGTLWMEGERIKRDNAHMAAQHETREKTLREAQERHDAHECDAKRRHSEQQQELAAVARARRAQTVHSAERESAIVCAAQALETAVRRGERQPQPVHHVTRTGDQVVVSKGVQCDIVDGDCSLLLAESKASVESAEQRVAEQLEKIRCQVISIDCMRVKGEEHMAAVRAAARSVGVELDQRRAEADSESKMAREFVTGVKKQIAAEYDGLGKRLREEEEKFKASWTKLVDQDTASRLEHERRLADAAQKERDVRASEEDLIEKQQRVAAKEAEFVVLKNSIDNKKMEVDAGRAALQVELKAVEAAQEVMHRTTAHIMSQHDQAVEQCGKANEDKEAAELKLSEYIVAMKRMKEGMMLRCSEARLALQAAVDVHSTISERAVVSERKASMLAAARESTLKSRLNVVETNADEMQRQLVASQDAMQARSSELDEQKRLLIMERREMETKELAILDVEAQLRAEIKEASSRQVVSEVDKSRVGEQEEKLRIMEVRLHAEKDRVETMHMETRVESRHIVEREKRVAALQQSLEQERLDCDKKRLSLLKGLEAVVAECHRLESKRNDVSTALFRLSDRQMQLESEHRRRATQLRPAGTVCL